MALVHEMLYRSQDLARVDFAEYVRTLVVQLFRSYNAAGKIRCVVEVEPAVFGVDLAVPCGLVINELVANALKHAFPADRKGELRVRMKSSAEGYLLSIADDGVGLPPRLDFIHTGTLGLQLVRMLTDQIGGELRVERSSGTEFAIRFPRNAEALPQ
jgi:two-component sensor histidine kinase